MSSFRGLLLLVAVLFAFACGVKSLPRPPKDETVPAPESVEPAQDGPCPTCLDAGTIPPRNPE